jgi:hypothetical protein
MECGLLAMKVRSRMVGAFMPLKLLGEALPIPSQIPSSNAMWVEESLMDASKNILERQ